VIVLDERRMTATRQYRNTVRTVARWAAAVALIALVVPIAAAGTGFAGFSDIVRLKASGLEENPLSASQSRNAF
jgi:hypothetical protein